MQKLLKLEELAQFIFSLIMIGKLSIVFSYLFILYFFLPDAFALGYLINRKLGASLYNFSHHKGVAIILMAIGLSIQQEVWILAGLLAYAHSSFDRAIGYGMKYVDSPDHTHLGFIGKKKHLNPPDHF